MALFQPTNIFPSSFAGQGGGTVDASQPLTVSWQVNGNSAMIAWQIDIFQNTGAASRVYTSGRVNITPFWGTSPTGETRYFSADIPRANLVNGYAPGYKLQITQWWDGGSVQQLSPSYFITRSAPRLEIDPFPSPITGRRAQFSARYTQAQGDALDWFRWLLCEKGREDAPLEDSGSIYGSGDIRAAYDGLFTGTQYRVRCLAQTENGIQADTGWVDFSVAYAVSGMQGYVDACRHPIEGIVLRWPLVSYIPGRATGPYTAAGGVLDLPEGSSVTWDTRNGAALSVEHPWTLAWSGILPPGGTSPVLTLGPGITFHVTAREARLDLNGSPLWRAPLEAAVSGTPMRLVVTPREVHFAYQSIQGGLFPAAGLFPAPGLYPNGGTKRWNYLRYPLTWVQPAVTALTLHGAQVCQWVTLLAGEASGALLDSLWRDLDFEPQWTLDTRLLASFRQGLNGGNITPVGDTVTGVALYRRREGESRLHLVANLEIGTAQLIDEGFRNQETYRYYLFVLGANTYVSAPLISNPITPLFWNWTVLETEWEDGAYHVKDAHVFRNNVSTDSITNNNSPQLLQTFTPYPNRQPSSANYQSSTLTGYIGRVDFVRNVYTDTVDMADRLRALSVSTRPKFLRDRKGNLWRVETAGPVSLQTGDNQAPQPYFASLPWVEAGPLDGASILCGPGDWGALEDPAQEDGRPRLVVTAPAGSLVTIAQNGAALLSRTWAGPVVFYPAPGTYTVRAEQAGSFAEKQVTVDGNETYYVGLMFGGETSAVIGVGKIGLAVIGRS